ALQLRLVDPATSNYKPGLGACDGDSGAPVYQQNAGRMEIIGVVSWSTAANNEAGCGGLTGVTPLELYRGWIIETARRMGIELPRGILLHHSRGGADRSPFLDLAGDVIVELLRAATAGGDALCAQRCDG